MYLGLSVLWSGMMAWAGMHIGGSISAVTAPLDRPADNTGKQVGNLGQMAISRGMKK